MVWRWPRPWSNRAGMNGRSTTAQARIQFATKRHFDGTASRASFRATSKRCWPIPRLSLRSLLALCPIGYERSELVRTQADALHDQLAGLGIDVLLDDRGERPGAMFADWELIGVPHRVVISERGLKDGKLEYHGRREAAATALAVDAVLAKFSTWRQPATATS